MELTVMSLNLRGPDDPPPRDWAHRRPRLASLLDRVRPDVVGTQEALAPMLDDVVADAGSGRPLAWVGRDRFGGHDDEHCAVLFTAARWRAASHRDVALSSTPERLGSLATATQGFPRMATWVRFVAADGTEVLVVNTHLDHVSGDSRAAAAAQLVDLVEAEGRGLPVVVTGDFNAEPGSTPWSVLTNHLTPVFPRAGERPDTFHGYGSGSGCIDWVLGRGVDVVAARVLDGGDPVSDHHPVLATLRLRAGG